MLMMMLMLVLAALVMMFFFTHNFSLFTIHFSLFTFHYSLFTFHFFFLSGCKGKTFLSQLGCKFLPNHLCMSEKMSKFVPNYKH